MSRFKGGSNPLPPPPQPLPFDRLPGFARHIIDPGAVPPFPNANGVLHPYPPTSQHQMNTNGNGRHVAYPHPLPVIDGGSTQQQPKSRKTRRADSTGTHNHENAPVATNGSAHTQAIFIPNRNSASPDQTELSRNTEKRNKRSVSFNESAQTSNRGYRANNGNGSGIPSRSRHSSGGTPGPSSSSRTKPKTSSSSQNKYTYVEPGTVQQPIPIPSTGASTSNRAKIIPGAHPEERIIPPREPLPPKFMREEPTAQSSVGWARRPQEGSSSHHYHRRRDHDERRRSYQGVSISRHVRGGVMSDGETDEVENRLNSASAFVAGYGSGYEEGLGYASASASAYRPYIPPPPHPERAMFSHGVVASTTSMQSVSVSASVDSEEVMTPRARPAETHRDSEPSTSTTTATWGSSSSDLLGRVPPASSQPPPPAVVGLQQQLGQILSNDNRPRTHDLPVVDDTPGRQSLTSHLSSVSSWGTVTTPSTSARGSFSDLNLIGLPQAQAVVRGDTETSTPVLGGEGDGTTSWLLGTYPNPRATQTSSSMGFTVEPRAGVVHTQGYSSEDERPRHHRSVSHPHVGTTTTGTTASGQNTNGTPSSQIGIGRSQQQQHRRRHTVTQSVSLDSGSLPPMGLGLTFDPSSSTATTATVDAQQQGGAAVQEGIRAPAPRMGGPNVITLWRP